MSRIGKKPVDILEGVSVAVADKTVSVEGPQGKLTYEHRPEVTVEVKDGQVVVDRLGEDRETRAYHGMTRALIKNMVEGVKSGYEKKLELHGVGYICSVSGSELSLRVGYANEIKKPIPEGIEVTCPDNTHINIKGCDKQRVGQFAAEVRACRTPEPYKGKGIRYVGEHVKIKPGKAAT